VTRRLLTLLLALLVLLPVVGSAQAAEAPVEPYARYEPQTTCSPAAKAGTKELGRWVVASFGGRSGAISRACAGSSVSEHKEGRAFDWTLNARSAADRNRAAALLKRLFAVGPSGEPAELARRMGVMYVIWNDRMYASYRAFTARAYLSSSCKTLRKCSRTLRHRDHLHLSLSRAGSLGRTSWYVGRVPAPAPAPAPASTPAS
jgi:hypothetical protein